MMGSSTHDEARRLVVGRFVLIGTLVVLPNRQDWPLPTALTVACSVGTVLGLAVMALTLAAGSAPRLLTLVALVLLLPVKTRWEETRLARRFEGYPDYAAHTPRFLSLRLRRSP